MQVPQVSPEPETARAKPLLKIEKEAHYVPKLSLYQLHIVIAELPSPVERGQTTVSQKTSG